MVSDPLTSFLLLFLLFSFIRRIRIINLRRAPYKFHELEIDANWPISYDFFLSFRIDFLTVKAGLILKYLSGN